MSLVFNTTTMAVIVCLLAALLPAIVLMVMIYRADSIEHEPIGLLTKLVLMGVVAALPALLLESGAEILLNHVRFTNLNVYAAVYALTIGLSEELCKFFFLYRGTWNNPDFNYRFDGIVYAAAVSLGFAAIENVLYIAQFGLGVALARALLAVPGHLGFAVYMGSFYGDAKVCEMRGSKRGITANLCAGYFSAVLLHTAYDACALSDSVIAMIAFVLFVILMYIFVFAKVRRARKNDVSVYQ